MPDENVDLPSFEKSICRLATIAALIGFAFLVIRIVLPILSERQAILAIERLGGNVRTQIRYPKWFWKNLDDRWQTVEQVSVSGLQGDIGLRFYCDLPDVQELRLDNTRVTNADLRHLRGLNSVEFITLSNAPVSDLGLKHLSELQSLESLDLAATRVTDDGLLHLKSLKNLNSLDIRLCPQISDTGIEHLVGLPNLEWLILERTNITNSSLEHLMMMPSLKWLSLEETNVTDDAVERLKMRLPTCEIWHRAH